MVFSHGFGCDQEMWRLLTPAFVDEYKIVLYDHVGFGRSQQAAWDPVRHSQLSTYSRELLEVIDDLGLSDVVFIGHSVASMIGVLAAIEAPDRFSDLVLVGPSPCYIDDARSDYVGGFSAADIDSLLEALDANYFGWSSTMAPVIVGNAERPELAAELRDSFCRTDPGVASTFARATFLSDNRADLALLDVPALVLQCTDDSIAPTQVGRYVADHIAISELVHLKATGHCPNLSAPEETAQAIKAYLGRRSQAP
jgi:sigma-B regulation protein RsbQ